MTHNNAEAFAEKLNTRLQIFLNTMIIMAWICLYIILESIPGWTFISFFKVIAILPIYFITLFIKAKLRDKTQATICYVLMMAAIIACYIFVPHAKGAISLTCLGITIVGLVSNLSLIQSGFKRPEYSLKWYLVLTPFALSAASFYFKTDLLNILAAYIAVIFFVGHLQCTYLEGSYNYLRVNRDIPTADFTDYIRIGGSIADFLSLCLMFILVTITAFFIENTIVGFGEAIVIGVIMVIFFIRMIICTTKYKDRKNKVYMDKVEKIK
jgi:hypothetical protein